MANDFKCNGEYVQFSNGATEVLYRHWVRLLEAETDSPGRKVLKTYLEERADLAGSTMGISGFGMDRDCMPDELLNMEAASILMKLVRDSAENVRGVQPRLADAWDEVPEGWHCTVAELWEDRLRKFHRALAAWVVPP